MSAMPRTPTSCASSWRASVPRTGDCGRCSGWTPPNGLPRYRRLHTPGSPRYSPIRWRQPIGCPWTAIRHQRPRSRSSGRCSPGAMTSMPRGGRTSAVGSRDGARSSSAVRQDPVVQWYVFTILPPSVVEAHLTGPTHVGLYPLLRNDRCRLLGPARTGIRVS